MRTRTIFLAVVLALGLVAGLVVTTAAQGPPPLPSSFWGTVRVDGQNVVTGTIVSAWINGVQYASFGVQHYPGYGSVYSINVPGDQSGTDAVEGGKAGDVVTFKVGGVTAAQSAAWQSGTNVRLDLTASTPRPVRPWWPWWPWLWPFRR